ncbi:Methyltransferase domain-containing protein [Pustulibacterium marinum]|uniref:Methyltransferase domain-containing protein n=1 Tax=Pustulibacterium marinum TaxID=1224947 RepID=A0A1I7GX57_9FLAO|nr:class I SAM-dependent methyltransferase [Pustulibacterium marinum]SFU52866.1 Methyltransferase domain-containing protein [Pustulibacterium marinum]
MNTTERKEHWDHIYETKSLDSVSWYQPVPETSLASIQKLNLPLDASIIDVGGGDSFLVDHLLVLGFTNITVLDISSKAIERAKERIGPKQTQVNWIVSDVLNFTPTKSYQLWHDRAAFHFLTEQKAIKTYQTIISKAVKPSGFAIIGTFSNKGPQKCSGIAIQQYSSQELITAFDSHFKKLACSEHIHITPFDTEQAFTFCTFQKK